VKEHPGRDEAEMIIEAERDEAIRRANEDIESSNRFKNPFPPGSLRRLEYTNYWQKRWAEINGWDSENG